MVSQPSFSASVNGSAVGDGLSDPTSGAVSTRASGFGASAVGALLSSAAGSSSGSSMSAGVGGKSFLPRECQFNRLSLHLHANQSIPFLIREKHA